MIRRAWQRAMMSLARSQSARSIMQRWSGSSRLAHRYVAGSTPEDAVRVAQALRCQRIDVSMFYLGEYVDSRSLVEENVRNILAVTRLLAGSDLDVHVSVDPTQIGSRLDWALAGTNAQAIANAIRLAADAHRGDRAVHCLMLDMEDSSVTQRTVELHSALRAQGLPAALTLQAYLRRTEADLSSIIAVGGKARLVRGAFAAAPELAYTKLSDVKENYRSLARLMLTEQARNRGFYPIFATHDTALHDHIIATAVRSGWPPGSFEFEMLYGSRPDVAISLADRGHRVRLYLPFGLDWWPYAVRRIGENPRTAYLLARAFAGL